MRAMKTEAGLRFNNDEDIDQIEGFTAKCANCGLQNVTVHYEFHYYGYTTGYDMELSMFCRDCENKYKML